MGVSLNAVLLLPFLTETAVLDGKTSGTVLIKKFSAKIEEHVLEAADKSSDSEDEDANESGEDKGNQRKKTENLQRAGRRKKL